MNKEKTLQIHNSTVEPLIFTGQSDDQSIEARYMQEEAVVRKFRTTVAKSATVQGEVAKSLQKPKKLKPPKT